MKLQTSLVFSIFFLILSSISNAQEATLTGPVVKILWANGSHSAHLAVVMKTAQGNFKLRRMGGNPFTDPKLEIYVGRSWSCTGTLLGGQQFMIRDCTPNHDMEEFYDDASYQLGNVLGDWDTLDGTIFDYWGVRIALNKDSGQIRLNYCDLWKLRFTKECQRVQKEEGFLSYSSTNGSLIVNEGSHSPNPTYSIQVNPSNPNRFIRTWGSRKIVYGRIR